jgi:hypothetical protein
MTSTTPVRCEKSGTLIIPPATPGYPLSTRYGVSVNGQRCPVYDTRVFLELNNPNRIVSFAQFDFTGTVEIEIEAPGPVTSLRVRPTTLSIQPQVEGRHIRFSLKHPAKLSVEINGGIDDNLHILAGEPETDIPAQDDPNVIYYGPGIHHIDGDYGVLRLAGGQTLYLASGAVLRARVLIEDARSVRIRGRGMLEGTTLLGRHPEYYRKAMGEPGGVKRTHFVQFIRCQDVEVEGIIMNDSPCWNLVFNHCRNVRVRDIKQFGYADNSDGIDVVSSQDVVIEDVFSRVNDDCIVIKSLGADTEDVTVRDCVLWSDRAVALQIGHETVSNTISRLIFRNIDILEQRNRYIGHYALGICNADNAQVSNVLFEDIRVENCERLITLMIEKGHYSRAEKRGRIENIVFRDIDSASRLDLHLYGCDEEHEIRGVTFENLTIRGKPVEPELFANLYVHDLTFVQGGATVRQIQSTVQPQTTFVPLDIAPICNRSRIDEIARDGRGWLDLGPDLDLRDLSGGKQLFGGIPFYIPDKPEQGAVVLRSSQHLVTQPYASYPLQIGRRVAHLFFLHGTAFVDTFVEKIPPEIWIGTAGKLRFNQSPTGIPLWHYRVRYQDDGTEISVPVQAGCNVEDWEIWAPGGWVVHMMGKKFYIQQWDNPYPDKLVASVQVQTALRPEVPIVLGITLGITN